MKDEKPGTYPFTRGIYSNMYKDRLWTMRQYAGLTSAKESNKRYHSLLKQGVMGLSVAFDLPTQIGYDSDNPLAAGEVGKVGVPISSIENMNLLFNNIPLSFIFLLSTFSIFFKSSKIFILNLIEKKFFREFTCVSPIPSIFKKSSICFFFYFFYKG